MMSIWQGWNSLLFYSLKYEYQNLAQLWQIISVHQKNTTTWNSNWPLQPVLTTLGSIDKGS